ncbi:MAG: hypothetical protein ACRDBO_16440 [Lachnospiraceae bacterium]
MASFCGECGRRLENGEQCTCKTGNVNNDINMQQSKQIVSKNKWKKIMYISQIIIGGLLAMLGFICIEYDWGYISVCAAAGFLITGIMSLVHINEV